jgi:hypothetical protein
MSKTEKHDKPCIRDLVSFLKATGRPVTSVDDWPDENEHGEIDAIAGPYAIEHTSVDSLPNGRQADARFVQVIGDLEQELAAKLGFPLAITWDWTAIETGPKWPAVTTKPASTCRRAAISATRTPLPRRASVPRKYAASAALPCPGVRACKAPSANASATVPSPPARNSVARLLTTSPCNEARYPNQSGMRLARLP